MRSGDLIILNSSHGVLVGMVIKQSGPVAHTNHVCGPELLVKKGHTDFDRWSGYKIINQNVSEVL